MSAPTRLFNRNFFLLWQGQLVSQLGNQLHAVALMFWIKHATGSASLMGTILMIAMLPGVILGPIGGTFADRFSRRRIIIWGDLIRGLSVLALAAILFTAPGSVDLTIAWLLVISVVAGIAGAFFRPAISAAIPDLVPHEKVAAANSLNQSSIQLSVFVGQGLGGVLFRLLGAPLLFLIDGITYLFSAVSECFIRIPQVIPESRPELRALLAQFKEDTLEGFHYVWERRGMRDLFIMSAFLNFLLAPFGVLLPFYVEDHLHARPDWFGFLIAAFGLGALLGYGIAGSLRLSGRGRAMIVILFLFLASLGFVAAGLVLIPVVALICFLLIGAFTGVVNINIMTTLQLTTPSEIRGRVFGLLGTLSSGLTPIGMGLAGLITDAIDHNVPLIYIISGAASAAVTLGMALDRHFREYLAFTPEDAESSERPETDPSRSPQSDG